MDDISRKLDQLVSEGLTLFKSYLAGHITAEQYREYCQKIIARRQELITQEYHNARELDYNRADAIMRGAR